MENTQQLPSYDEIEETRKRNEARRLAEGGTNSAPGALQELPEELVADPAEYDGEVGGVTTGRALDEGPERFQTAADDPEFGEEPGGQVHLVVEGRHEKLNTKVEGRTPTSSTLAITGGKVEVGGQYQPGDVVNFVLTVVIDQVAFRDEKDSKTQQVVGRARNHKGYISGIREQD
jgi:hypothetical protein